MEDLLKWAQTGFTLARVRAFDKRSEEHTPGPLRGIAILVGLVGCALTAGVAPATGQAPDEEWRTLETAHFSVTYPIELEEVARRAADRAERAYAALESVFIEAPQGRIDLIVTDHTDQANGSATILPSNRITIFASPPVESLSLQYFDDWLEILLTHELAHIFHLDRSHPAGRVIRKIFGRVPLTWLVFPEAMVPTWTIEGIATHLESEVTDSGRSKGTYSEMVLRTAALEDAFEEIDQLSGASPVWPAGPRPYIYGSKFFDYLTETHGQDAVSEFVEAIQGQWIPFRLNSAAKNAFGTSMSDAWDAWADVEASDAIAAEASDAVAAGTMAQGAAGRTVLDHGRFALYPQTSPDGKQLLLARSDGRTNSQLRRYDLDEAGEVLGNGDKVTRTNGFATFSWTPDGSVLFAQSDFVDPYRSYSDLYHADPGGSVRRITTRARLSQPSAAPDGLTAVAVRGGGSAAQLVEVDLNTGDVRAITERSTSVLWASPRISPDGRWIVASRWTPGGYLDLVILGRDGTVVSQITRDRASDAGPTWSGDGRYIVWASDQSGVLNLYGVRVDDAGSAGPPRQITRVRTGIAHPWVDPESRWIYASVYHADGWDIDRYAFDPSEWFDPDALDPRFATGGENAAQRFEDRSDAPSQEYSAGRSLLPRYWIPTIVSGQEVASRQVVGLSYGFETSGWDLVGRHAYGLGVRYEPKGNRFSGGLGYNYAGLGTPILGLSVGQAYDADPRVGLREDSTRVQLFEVERFQSATLSASFPRIRRRSFSQITLAGSGVWTASELLDANLTPSQDFRLRSPKHSFVQGRASVAYTNVQGHAYSVSGEDGVSVALSGRVRTELSLASEETGVPGFDDSLDDVIGTVRAFRAFSGPGFARHVVAARFSGGVSQGPGADRFHFDLGGAAGQGESTGLGGTVGGIPLLFPLRGYGRDIRSGKYAWSASGEYRFPLALVHRGTGLLPLYFDRIWGALFFDAGNAWGDLAGFDVPNPSLDPLMAVGGELTIRLVPFWTVPIDVRFGLGMPLQDVVDPVTQQRVGDSPRFYVRLGRSF